MKLIENKSSKKYEVNNSLLNIDILNKLLSFLWLFDNNNNIIISTNNGIDNKDKINEIYEQVENNYSLLLIEFLKSYCLYNFKSIKCLSDNSLYQIKNINDEKHINSSKSLKLEENKENRENKENNNISLIEYFFDKTLEKTWNSYIFSKMVFIILNANLINKLEDSKIEKLKYIFIRILNNKEEKYNDNKKLLFLSFLQILIFYYFSEDGVNSFYKKEDFHLFIRSLDLNLDLFYAIISSINTVKYFSNDTFNNNEDYEFVFEIIEKDDYIKSKNNLKREKNINDIIKYKDILSIYTSPFEKIDLKNLNKIQIYLIKSLLEDLIYLLIKLDKSNKLKKSENDIKNIKYTESSGSTLSLDYDIGNEIFDTLKKNIDIISSFQNTEIFNQIFSYNTKICSEFFYLKWKFYRSNNESKNIEGLLIKYHQDLLKFHISPFIFKFLLILSKNTISKENLNEYFIENQMKISLLAFIIDTINDLKNNKDNIFIYHLLNVIIIFNQEMENNSKNFFTNCKFKEIFYKYINLLHQSSLLYSNYYINLEDNFGKLICEIIFDIFFEISQYYSNEEDFWKFFTRGIKGNENEKDNERYTMFYLMDLLKENILEKDNKTKNDLEKYISKSKLNNLKNIHINLFNQKIKQFELMQKIKLYPIEGFNFSIYFLSKSFLYLESQKTSKKLNKLLEEKFLPLLLNNINRLYNKKKNYYEDKTCKKFPLYSKTKSFFEANQNPIKFEKYKKFFKEYNTTINTDYNIKLHFASRLINEYPIINPKTNNKLNSSISMKKITKMDNKNKKYSNLISTPLDLNKSSGSNSSILLDDINITKCSDDFSRLSIEKEEINYFSKFERIKKDNIIYNPKKYFFNIIFSNIFKNLIFKDKIFKSIRLWYLIKYRNHKNVIKESKQLNYPTKQKNFSNFLEPKIFLKRDKNFYNDIYFPVLYNLPNPKIIKEKQEEIYFYPHEYKINDTKRLNDKIIYCDLITTEYKYFGKMTFTYNFILFETEKDPRNTPINEIELEELFKYSISTKISNNNETNKQKSVLIFTNDIKEIIQRRALLINQSIEIFNKNGKSYFFNFFRTDEVKQVYNYLININNNLKEKFSFNIDNNKEEIKNILESFHKGRITNYEYILYLNKYSTRTYNDLSQYPIFPWLLIDYSKIDNILNNLLNNKNEINDLRDMRYPLSVQTPESRKEAIIRFQTEKTESFPSHFGTHYSNSSYIFYYLMRINPYTRDLIELQNFKVEEPDRTFNSLKSLEEIIFYGYDNRELIPDIFCYIDFYINANCSFFGIKNDKNIVDDFIVINNFTSNKYVNYISIYINFLYNLKKLLNHRYISDKICDWVDIIFGRKQLPKKEEKYKDCCNIFKKYSYEQKTNL